MFSKIAMMIFDALGILVLSGCYVVKVIYDSKIQGMLNARSEHSIPFKKTRSEAATLHPAKLKADLISFATVVVLIIVNVIYFVRM